MYAGYPVKGQPYSEGVGPAALELATRHKRQDS